VEGKWKCKEKKKITPDNNKTEAKRKKAARRTKNKRGLYGRAK